MSFCLVMLVWELTNFLSCVEMWMKFGITKGVDTRGALQSQQNFWCASRVGFPLKIKLPPLGHVLLVQARLTVFCITSLQILGPGPRAELACLRRRTWSARALSLGRRVLGQVRVGYVFNYWVVVSTSVSTQHFSAKLVSYSQRDCIMKGAWHLLLRLPPLYAGLALFCCGILSSTAHVYLVPPANLTSASYPEWAHYHWWFCLDC